MADFYSDIRAKSASLHAKYAQGTVTLSRTTTVPGENEWDPPVETTVSYPLDAVVQGVASKYLGDGSTIIASDLQVQFSPPAGIVPAITDTITVNGVDRAPKRILPIPASGDPVAFSIFVASWPGRRASLIWSQCPALREGGCSGGRGLPFSLPTKNPRQKSPSGFCRR